ncbi:29756_t:CDS:1, partial [Gigaspora margarita]
YGKVLRAKLLEVAYKHPGHYCIAKHFLCSSWEMVDLNFIKRTNVENEFL